MLDLLLITIFTCHLLAVDLAMAGPLVSIWLEWRATRRADPLAGEIGRRLAIWSLAAAAIGIGLGLIAVVALPQFEPAAYRRTFGHVPSLRWWYAAAELAFYMVGIAAYVLLWRRLSRHRIWHRALAILATTNLIYHFPPLFTIISALSMRPRFQALPLNVALYHQLMLDGEVMSRVVHHWLAAAAVAAAAAMVMAARGKGATGNGQGTEAETAPVIVRQAARGALVASLLQVPAGVWVLFALPVAMQNQLLGEDAMATALFGLSVVAALGLMHHLAMASYGEVSRRPVYRTALIMVLVVTLMVATLHRARQCVLEQMRPAKMPAE